MIAFFKHDLRLDPADLVGKLVGKEGSKPFRSYSLPLLVVGFSGKRLHMKACEFSMDEILPVSEWTEDVDMLVHKVFYVCDTVEEATIIRNTCHEAQRLYDLAQKVVQADIGKLFAQVG
jgi:hypothetical protein